MTSPATERKKGGVPPKTVAAKPRSSDIKSAPSIREKRRAARQDTLRSRETSAGGTLLMGELQMTGSRHLEFSQAYLASPNERITVIKAGIPARLVDRMATAMTIPKEEFMQWVGLPRATVNRKARNEENLSPEHSERLLGIVQLVGKVEAMIEESGDPTGFDAAKWVKEWLNTQLPALGGRRPAEYMDTMEGQKFVSNLLEMTQSGAYA